MSNQIHIPARTRKPRQGLGLQAILEGILDGAADPIGEIVENEKIRGYEVIQLGDRPWLPASDWLPETICSLNGSIVRLVLIAARMPGTGALTRCLAGIERAGFIPNIVEPTDELQATLRRRGWRHKTHGRTFKTRETVWRPR